MEAHKEIKEGLKHEAKSRVNLLWLASSRESKMKLDQVPLTYKAYDGDVSSQTKLLDC